MESLNSKILDLSPDLYVDTAKEKYQNFAKSKEDEPLIYNPTSISEEITFKKELFSKLKFQYLEQETREKFIRAILDDPPLYVGQLDIDQKVEANKDLKQQLKELKETLAKLGRTSKDLSREVLDLYEVFQGKAKATDLMIDEIEAMDREFEAILQDNEHLRVFVEEEGKTGEDGFVTSVDQVSGRLSKSMSREEASLLRLNSELGLRQELLESQKRTIGKLTTKLQTLVPQVDGTSSVPTSGGSDVEDKEQAFAQWVKEMNDIWSRLYLNKISIDVIGINRIFIRRQPIRLDEDLEMDVSSLDIQLEWSINGNDFVVKSIKSPMGKNDPLDILPKIKPFKSYEQIAKVIEYSF